MAEIAEESLALMRTTRASGVSRENLGAVHHLERARGLVPSLAFVSTYPPTPCGLATFTASLRTAIEDVGGQGVALDVVQVIEGDQQPGMGPETVGVLRPDDPESVRTAAQILNLYDTVVIQHEYGIYGSRSGWAVIDLLERLTTPAIAVMHTVLRDPSPLEREVVERMHQLVSKFVVQSRAAATLLTGNFGIPMGRIEVIPHGTHPVPRLASPDKPAGPPTILTWGLIGPGKGLEWPIRALPAVIERFPEARFVVAGRTHPKVLEREGERYRESLVDLAAELGVAANVEWVNDYMPREQVHDLLRQASVVVLPYDSTAQTVSGILVEAITAEVPVVATRFPHAAEMAADGAVLLVDHKNPAAMAEAILLMLEDSPERRLVEKSQRTIGPSLTWNHVARRYLHLAARMAAGRTR